MTSKRKLTNTHKEAIRRGVVTYHAKCKRCLSNNNRTKRIKELFERQKLRKQRWAALEARQKVRRNTVAKLTKKKS